MSDMWIVRPTIQGKANLKLEVSHFEISVAFDDSCGKLHNLSRGNIRVFDNNLPDENSDITEEIFGVAVIVDATYANLRSAINWCDTYELRKEREKRNIHVEKALPVAA